MRRKPQMHDASCQTTGETEGAGEWGDALPELKRGNATATLMERLDRTRRKTMRGDSPKKKTRSKKKSQDLDSKVADFDWTIKQVLALFEKRAEAEAAIKASTRRGAGAESFSTSRKHATMGLSVLAWTSSASSSSCILRRASAGMPN